MLQQPRTCQLVPMLVWGAQHGGAGKTSGDAAMAKPGYHTPRPYRAGEAHRPPAVPPAPPTRTLGQNILDIVIKYWNLQKGAVKDRLGSQGELVKGKTVKQNVEAELRVEALEVFGPGSKISGVFDKTRNSLVIRLVGVGAAARPAGLWGAQR
jgi:hypothetical protein